MSFFRKTEQSPEVNEIPQIFSYSYAYNNINSNRIPSCIINGLNYELVIANSFIKLRTEKGLKYWISQAEQARRQPDWKIHFAIREEDIPAAWDIIAKIYLNMGGEYIMKAKTHPAAEWPKYMHGREITVYVPIPCHALELTNKNIPPNKFWRKFIQTCEYELNEANIENKAIADGELQLGKYCSLRNEAFVAKTPNIILEEESWEGFDNQLALSNPKIIQYIYPPNSLGYNAAKHDMPGFVKNLQWGRKMKGPH